MFDRVSAYDAAQIHALSRHLGHVPIIDPNPRGGKKVPLAPAEEQRFKERTASERVNSLLKERYGGRWVRVRGAAKVMCHLMFGLVALTATALFARYVEASQAHRQRLAALKLAIKPVAAGGACSHGPENRRQMLKARFSSRQFRQLTPLPPSHRRF
jgi:hypothetical protein